jgi:hypothetical protein
MTSIHTSESTRPRITFAANIATVTIPALLILSCAALAVQPELRLATPLLIGVTAAMVSLLAVTLYAGERSVSMWPSSVILAVALLLRLLFLGNPPQLSDDIYRYLWDGSNLLHAVNPYAAPPSLMKPRPGLETIHSLINHPEYVTIYPPAAQLVFAGGAALGGSITGVKALLVLIDLGLCALLARLLKQLGRPVWLAALYAWNPLPVVEIAGSGHVDGAGMALLLASISLILSDWHAASSSSTHRRRWRCVLAGVSLAGAALVKLFPLALAPVLLLLVPRNRRLPFLAAFFGALAALLFPFMPELTRLAGTLNAYGKNWEFAGFAFNTLRSLTGSGTIPRLLLVSGFALAVAAITLASAGPIQRARSGAEGGEVALDACFKIAMAFLLLTPTLQPWYALSLAALLPFCPRPAGLVLCWAVFLTYQVQIPYYILGRWIENPQVTAAVFLSPVAAYLLCRLPRVQRSRR